MIEISPDGKMRTLTTVLPESEEPAKYKTLSGFMPSGNLVKSAQSPPGPMPFDTSHLTKTVRPMRRAWQWVVSDSHRFTQPVSCSSWDTDYYAAIQTEWPMLRPPVTLDVHIKETCPAPVTLTAAMLLVT